MKRRLFTLAAAVSLVLCVATLTLWVRSYFIDDHVEYARLRGLRFSTFSVRSSAGLLAVYLGRFDLVSEEKASQYRRTRIGFRHRSHTPWPRDVRWLPHDGLLGSYLSMQAGSPDGSGTDTYIDIPYWLAVTVTTLLPAMWLVVRIRRRHPGVFCLTCGYDLRATPDRCPECGNVPEGN